VLIPFASDVATPWYSHTPTSNRTLNDFYRLIKGVALMHYRTRKVKNGWLVATPADYDIARQIFCGMKLKLSAPLLKTLHALQALEVDRPEMRLVEGQLGEANVHTYAEIADEAYKSEQQLYDDLAKLADVGLVKKARWMNDPDGQYKKRSVFYLTEFAKNDIIIKSWKELKGEESGAYTVIL